MGVKPAASALNHKPYTVLSLIEGHLGVKAALNVSRAAAVLLTVLMGEGCVKGFDSLGISIELSFVRLFHGAL